MSTVSMLTYDEAIAIVLGQCSPLESHTVTLAKSYGKILAENLISRDTLPPAPMSNRDGFAVRASDVESASADNPISLKVIGIVACGSVPKDALEAGQAMQTMTGAIVCEGADTIVMVEDTKPGNDGEVRILKASPAGLHIREPGSDVKPKQLVLPTGSSLGAAQIALAATLGYHEVEVIQSPLVGILATGDELLSPEEELVPGKIRNSNGFSLQAQAESLGCKVRNLGTAPDKPERILALVESALDCNVIIVSGGASVGEFDFIDKVLAELGAKTHFDRVAVKPGKPVTFATLGEDKLLFGLPGNPVSSLVSFEIFCRPALQTLAGRKNLFLPTVKATTKQDIKSGMQRRNYMRCVLHRLPDSTFEVTLSGLQESFVTSGVACANGLLVVEKGTGGAKAGETLDVLLLCDLSEV